VIGHLQLRSNSLLKKRKSGPDRNVRITFFNEPEASGGTGIPVSVFSTGCQVIAIDREPCFIV